MSNQLDGSGSGTRRALAQRLESLDRAGVAHLKKGRPRPAAETPATAAAPPTPAAEQTTRVADTGGQSRRSDDADALLRLISADVAKCTRCKELVANRTQTVFGVGNPRARLCFLGEAPGADEDRQGEPFVGRAGQLLTKIIENAMGLKRGDIYILNILKCRPPENRNPTPEEAANCRRHLDDQFAAIRPEYICCLGAVAAQNLLETTVSIGRMRGNFYDYQGIKVICTYHPAYLLRNPAAKKQTWEDIQMLMREMGLPVKQ